MKPVPKQKPALRKLTQKNNIDKSIRPFIDRMRAAGYDTCWSCSATLADHGADLESCMYSYLWIKLPEGVMKNRTSFYVRYPDIRNKAVYRKFKRIGKKSGWLMLFIRRIHFIRSIHFTGRKKRFTPMACFILCYKKRKLNDKRILQAWERLTKNLEKINAYKTYF